ncbi:MAG: glycosyltransferase family 4 protein [Candidatus Bathyarchaeia archaeon]|jgi:glycosyltransferase involved in cell wall biosynthesis
MLAPELLPIWGGVGTYIVELIRHLPSTVEVEVVTPYRTRIGSIPAATSNYNLEDYFPNNVHINFLGSAADTFVYNAAFQTACFRHVPRLLKRENIELIHSHTAHMPDLLLQLRRLKVANVTTVHTTIAGQKRAAKSSGTSFSHLDFSEKATLLGYPFLRIAERFYFSGEREYITLSNWMKIRVGLYFPRLNGTRVTVIHNSVDSNVFTPRGKEEPENILFTGRFIAAKGLTYLAEAIPRVLSNHPNATFTFIGPGDFQPYMNRLLELNVPSQNVKFVGYVKDSEAILDYYRHCSIFVAPTLYENLPTRVLEAMACAKPVIATDVSAIPEVIASGHNGILVPPRSSEALANAINGLLENPRLRKLIGANARDTVVSKFDWNVNARKIASLYGEVIQGFSRR